MDEDQAIAELRDKLATIQRTRENERARAIRIIGDLLDGGTWPHKPALKVIGGHEMARRALDPAPFPSKQLSEEDS